jgi:uncharacterized protein YdaL
MTYFDVFQTTAPPYDTLDNNTKNQINMLSSEIGMMNQLKLIAETEQQRVQTAIINATTTYQNINQQLENVNYTLSGIVHPKILQNCNCCLF